MLCIHVWSFVYKSLLSQISVFGRLMVLWLILALYLGLAASMPVGGAARPQMAGNAVFAAVAVAVLAGRPAPTNASSPAVRASTAVPAI